MRRAVAVSWLALTLCSTLAQGATPGPAPGRYEGRFCVAVGDAAPDCGPARVDVLRRQRLNVRIADIVYLMQLRSSQVDVVLMQGTMQIDGFFADYAWADDTLNFVDTEKRTRYSLHVVPRATRH